MAQPAEELGTDLQAYPGAGISDAGIYKKEDTRNYTRR